MFLLVLQDVVPLVLLVVFPHVPQVVQVDALQVVFPHVPQVVQVDVLQVVFPRVQGFVKGVLLHVIVVVLEDVQVTVMEDVKEDGGLPVVVEVVIQVAGALVS